MAGSRTPRIVARRPNLYIQDNPKARFWCICLGNAPFCCLDKKGAGRRQPLQSSCHSHIGGTGGQSTAALLPLLFRPPPPAACVFPRPPPHRHLRQQRPLRHPPRGLRLRAVPGGPAGHRRPRGGRRRCAGADAHRRRQVAVLPDPGHRPAARGQGRGDRGVAAHRADARPGGCAARGRRERGLPQLHARLGRDAGRRAPHARSASLPPSAGCCAARSRCCTRRPSG